MTLSWEELRLIWAIDAYGTAQAAARPLDVTPSTVYRRLSALEDALGFKLFDRLPERYMPLPACEALLIPARQMAQLATLATDALHDHRDVVQGKVIITAPDALIDWLLGVLMPLRQQHEGLQLELRLSTSVLSLFKRDADIALRITQAPPEGLWGRRLTPVAMAPYAQRAWWSTRSTEAPWPWIISDEEAAQTPLGRWERAQIPAAQRALEIGQRAFLAHAVRAGFGVGLLPCAIAETDPALVRVGEVMRDLLPELWLLTHPELRAQARVRVVFDALSQAILAQRGLIAFEDDDQASA